MGERGELTPEQMGLKPEEPRISEKETELLLFFNDIENTLYNFSKVIKNMESGVREEDIGRGAYVEEHVEKEYQRIQQIIGGLSSEEKGRLNEHLQSRANIGFASVDVPGSTVDEKWQGLQVRLENARKK